VSLKEAREKGEEIRRTVRNGDDPSELRKKRKIEIKKNVFNTFENIAREWLKKKRGSITPRHALCIMRRLEANIFLFLGSMPIKKITPRELLAVIRQIETRGAFETAHRMLQKRSRTDI
jgi:integrase